MTTQKVPAMTPNQEILKFARDNVWICTLTLGLAILAFATYKFLGRTVSWIVTPKGRTAAVDKVANESLKKSEMNTKKTDSNSSTSKLEIPPTISPVNAKVSAALALTLNTTASDYECRAPDTGLYSASFEAEPEPHYIVSKIVAHDPGNGFGTKCYRKTMQSAGDLPVKTIAEDSSHFFHLKMGMIPKNRLLTMEDVFGINANRTYGKFIEMLRSNDPHRLGNGHYIHRMKEILFFIRHGRVAEGGEHHRIKDLEESRQEILDFVDGKCTHLNFIRIVFIPHLIKLLSKDPTNRMANTSELGPIEMEMSPQGRERWQRDIAGIEPFKSFKNLGHLYPYMTVEQIECLDKEEIAAKKLEI